MFHTAMTYTYGSKRGRAPTPERQLWLGNVPNTYGYNDVRAEFVRQGYKWPAHVVVNWGGKDTSYAIVTMHEKAAAEEVMAAYESGWNAFRWTGGRHAVVRRSKCDVQWAPMMIMLADCPWSMAALPAAAALHLGRCSGKMV